MKSVLSIAALLLLAPLVIATPHLETVFSISMPGAVNVHPKPIEVLRGEMFYVSTNAGIVASNLTSQSVAWTANITNPEGSDDGHPAAVPVFFHGDSIFVCTESGIYKLNAATGHQTWSIPNPGGSSCDNMIFGSEEVVAVLFQYQMCIVEITSGTINTTTTYATYSVGETAANGPVAYGNIGDGAEFSATEVFSGTQLWSYNTHAAYGFEVLAALPDYVVCTNYTNNYEDKSLIVLTAAHGTEKVNIGAMKGVGSSGFTPKIVNGHDLVVVAGEEVLREMTIDLNTGYIIKQVPYAGASSSSYSVTAADIGAEIRVTKSLALQVGPIGGPFTTAADFTPSAGSFNLQYYSQGIVQVGNLQGWTMWQVSAVTKKATFLGCDEKAPSWTAVKGTPLTFDGADIKVQGAEIVATKLVL